MYVCVDSSREWATGGCAAAEARAGGGTGGIRADPAGGAMRAWGDRLDDDEHDDEWVDPREVVVRVPRRDVPLRPVAHAQRRRRRGPRAERGAPRARSPRGAARSRARQGVPLHDPAQPRDRPGAPSRAHRDRAARRGSRIRVDTTTRSATCSNAPTRGPSHARRWPSSPSCTARSCGLRFAEELDNAAIAQRLHITEHAARQRVYRAMQALRAIARARRLAS